MKRSEVEGLAGIWPEGRPLIGMVHLEPLPGSPRWGGSMLAVLARAEADARALQHAGFDGILVENFLDAPFFPTAVPPETTAALTRSVSVLVDRLDIPIGVNVLRNDGCPFHPSERAHQLDVDRPRPHRGSGA